MADALIRLIRITTNKNIQRALEGYIEVEKPSIGKEELEQMLSQILRSEAEILEAKYAASRLVTMIRNSDPTTIEHTRLMARAALLLERVMEEYTAGKLTQQTLRVAKEALTIVMLQKTTINIDGDTLKIVRGQQTIATIKIERKTTENEETEDEYLAFYYTNPVSRVSLELMVDRTDKAVNMLGYKWAAWNLLPVFGGELIKIVDGKPSFKQFSGASTLRRFITYHSVFSLANYYESIAKEKMAFEHVENDLKHVKKLLKDLSDLQDAKSRLESAIRRCKDKNRRRELEAELRETIEKIQEIEEQISKTLKNLIGKVWRSETMFSRIERLRPLEQYYKKHLADQIEEIASLIKKGKMVAATNRIEKMLSAAKTLKKKIGAEKQILELIEKALTTRNPEEARNAIRKLVETIDNPEQKEETASILEEATTYTQLLQEMHPDILRKPKPKLKDDIKQQLRTGIIVGLMSALGSIIGYIILAQTLNSGNTAILDTLNFKAPTLIWILAAATITVLTVCLLKRGFIGKGKAIALAVAMGIGIWSYAKAEKKGILGEMELFVPLSGMLWVWDEFDDFQDGYSRLKGKSEPPDIMDTLELWLLPAILGMFGVWMGTDQYLVATKIPGRWGFAKYAAEANVPSPWDVVVNAAYEILAFIIANVIASGAMGLGWVIYTAGSVLGSLLMSSLLGDVFSLVFS